MPLLLGGLYLAILSLIVGIFFFVFWLTSDDIFIAAARNCVIYFGVAFAGVAILRAAGPALAILTAVFGVVMISEHTTPLISWVVRVESAPVDVALAMACAAAGLGLWFFRVKAWN